MKFAALIASFVVTFSACQNKTTTQELLEANFVSAGKTQIDLLSPTQDQQVATSNPTFSWGDRGAGLYTIEVASDANFKNVVLNQNVNGTQYTLANSALIGVSSLTTNSYHWRVKVANIANNLQSKTGTFFLVAIPLGGSGSAGVLYVNTASTASLEIGSREKPYKRIQAAIANADALRNYHFGITMDIYVAQGSYTEEVILSPGISLRGGYEPNNWTRSISSYTTTINAPLVFAVRGAPTITTAYTNTTWLEGFTIIGPTATTSNANIAGVTLASSSPTIAYNTIRGGLTTSTSAVVAGIDSGTGSAYIFGNTILGASGCTGCNYVQGIYANGSVRIFNNVIVGSTDNAGVSLKGITTQGAGTQAQILNNTIVGNTANFASSSGISVENGSLPIIRNNIIFNLTSAGAGFGTCVYEGSNTSDPTNVQNNNLFGCTIAYSDFDSGCGGTNCSIAQLNALGAGYSGNVGISNAGNQLLTSINGTDGNISTLSDNDWHLTTNGAICDVRGGGQNLSSSFITDKDILTRTIGNPSGGCTSWSSVTGATGWSMGAFEQD